MLLTLPIPGSIWVARDVRTTGDPAPLEEERPSVAGSPNSGERGRQDPNRPARAGVTVGSTASTMTPPDRNFLVEHRLISRETLGRRHASVKTESTESTGHLT
jgi:hypothetical protein